MQAKRLRLSAACGVVMSAWMLPTQAFADFFTGEKLYEFCTSKDIGKNNVCGGYVMGVLDSWDTERLAKREASCTPVSTSGGQVVEYVIQHLKTYHNDLDLPAAIHVVGAISEIYKCFKVDH